MSLQQQWRHFKVAVWRRLAGLLARKDRLAAILANVEESMRAKLVLDVLTSHPAIGSMLDNERTRAALFAILRSGATNLQESYSQEGEDIILARLCGAKGDGFYVDVGAHHPFRFSNTYLFYLRGWRGINIDATPGSMDAFRRLRPRDINLELFVSTDPTPQRLHLFNEPALNTASAALAARRGEENSAYRVVGTVAVASRSLASILDEYVQPGQIIDILNIDVEGMDLDVLRSNNWTKYRPTFVLAEILDATLADLDMHDVTVLLRGQGYRPACKLLNTAIFLRQD